MSEVLKIKHPKSLSKIAEEHIRAGIVNGVFRLGESLQEAKLSEALGISKTPIREALAALKLQGLVQIVPRHGAFVFTLSKEDVVQLCQFRLLLETAAMEQAFYNERGDLLEGLQKIVSQMAVARQENAFELYMELDARFHDVFFEFCGNNYLLEAYQKVGDIVRTMRTHLSKRSDRTEKSFNEHEAILVHLNDGKIKSAATVLKRQVTRGERAYSDLISVKK